MLSEFLANTAPKVSHGRCSDLLWTNGAAAAYNHAFC